MQKQMTIPGTETGLSIAAEKFMDARDELQATRDELSDLEQKLITAMYDHKKYSLKLRGYTLSIKQAKEPKDKIQVSEG